MSFFQLGAFNDYFPYGEAIITSGLVVRDAIDGLGLVTFGLLWTGGNIWLDIQAVDGISTIWTLPWNTDGIVTTWTYPWNTDGITTTWADSVFGVYGEYPAAPGG